MKLLLIMKSCPLPLVVLHFLCGFIVSLFTASATRKSSQLPPQYYRILCLLSQMIQSSLNKRSELANPLAKLFLAPSFLPWLSDANLYLLIVCRI